MKTYISLFSCAGIGCFGFKQEGFECIATNELEPRRIAIQAFNNKCRYDSGYICGDITEAATHARLNAEIDMWRRQEKIKSVDVVIATPPCQGMSVANHKKTDHEICRNSLVIESIKLIKEIRPKFFVFENVPAFMKTPCTDVDGQEKTIAEAISNNLGDLYSYTHRIINFKQYGACSSRSRTLVIGVSNTLSDDISPMELFPALQKEKTLREVIGSMKSLTELGETDPDDIFHSFRAYPAHMREWIRDLKEGQSAFDNEDDSKKPHKTVDGKTVINRQKNGDKYRRQFWDKVGPCIHTRNDQLASQNTIHPKDDRVFSIRELMHMMTVPDCFMWDSRPLKELNALSPEEKREFLKKSEMNIRQTLGEAVPTAIFRSIAANMSKVLDNNILSATSINNLIRKNDLTDTEKLLGFIEQNPLNLSVSTLGRIAELSNSSRTENAAFYTNKALITEIMKALPDIDKPEISVLEPSAGVGNFIPLLLKRYEGKKLNIDLMDINPDSLRAAEALLKKYDVGDNCKINFIADDFLLHEFESRYDLVIGNPPFLKVNRSDPVIARYVKSAINKESSNLCSFFLDKTMELADYVAIVFPKFILNTPEFSCTRDYLSKKRIDCILDFGEKGFHGVMIETVALLVNTQARPLNTTVSSLTYKITQTRPQKYICDPKLPYWIIYRNEEFDRVFNKMDFDQFVVFRDRQLTNSMLKDSGEIRVLKSQNIRDDGSGIEDIPGYDSYIDAAEAKDLAVYRYLDHDGVYLTPNMTYKPRVIRKPRHVLANGSVAILTLKSLLPLTDRQLSYFSSDEYRNFYKIARNFQTRSLNVDKCSVFFYGILRE